MYVHSLNVLVSLCLISRSEVNYPLLLLQLQSWSTERYSKSHCMLLTLNKAHKQYRLSLPHFVCCSSFDVAEKKSVGRGFRFKAVYRYTAVISCFSTAVRKNPYRSTHPYSAEQRTEGDKGSRRPQTCEAGACSAGLLVDDGEGFLFRSFSEVEIR